MVLDHIALIISEEKNLGFYEKLGFKIVKRIERSRDIVVFMECDGIILEAFIDPSHPKRESNPESNGLRHIAFSVDDFETLCENLAVEEIRTDWLGNRLTFVNDPDGQPIEIKERG